MKRLSNSQAQLLRWTAGFLAFPLAGIAGGAVAGPVDGPGPALIGGAVCGLVIGAGQTVAASGRLAAGRWIPATAAGMGVGLLIGASAVGYGTSISELAAMGLLSGLPLGIGQALALPATARRRWLWAVAMPVLWSLGWVISTLIGVDVGAQYTNFGASGAVTVTVLAGLLLRRLTGRVPGQTALNRPARPAASDVDR